MSNTIDIASMTAAIPMFNEIDNLVNGFYNQIKGLEPKTIADVENNKELFLITLKKIVSLVEKSEYSKEEQSILISRLFVDFHVIYAEKFNLDVFAVSNVMGEYSIKKLQESIKILDFVR